jgi:hypothetical protein
MSKTPEQLAVEWLKEEYGDTSHWTYMGQEMSLDAFYAGYQAAAPQWISVKDRLPPPEVKVLWWNETADQAGVSSYEYMSHCNDTMIEWGDAGYISIKNFTHWMPLPKPPEDAKE